MPEPAPDKTPDKRAGDLGFVAGELVRARSRLGLSQSQVAERSGLSRNSVMGYESGRNKPGAREIRLLCEVLQVTPNQLIFGTEEPFKKQDDYLRSLGITSDDQEVVFLTIMFRMLGRDEKSSMLTLIHSILEARHGDKFKEILNLTKSLTLDVTAEAFKEMGIEETALGRAAEKLLQTVEKEHN